MLNRLVKKTANPGPAPLIMSRKNYGVPEDTLLYDMAHKIDILMRRVSELEDKVYGVVEAEQHKEQLNPGVSILRNYPIIEIEKEEVLSRCKRLIKP